MTLDRKVKLCFIFAILGLLMLISFLVLSYVLKSSMVLTDPSDVEHSDPTTFGWCLFLLSLLLIGGGLGIEQGVLLVHKRDTFFSDSSG